jgi:hypothetical protein
MTEPYGTPRDPSLTHQVVFDNNLGNGAPLVSCNCRKRWKMPAMGDGPDLDEARVLYNDPKNHVEPFNKEDEAKW